MKTNSLDYATLEEFLKLRRLVRVLSLACSMLVIIVAVLFLAAFNKPHVQAVPDVITAKKFIVVDNTGKTLATLGPGTNPSNMSELQLYSNAYSYITLSVGNRVASFRMHADGSEPARKSSNIAFSLGGETGADGHFDHDKGTGPPIVLRHVLFGANQTASYVTVCGNTQGTGFANCKNTQQP